MAQTSKKKPAFIVIFFIIILIPAIWFMFMNKGSDLEKVNETLIGKWQRTDGPYTIEISSVKKDGVLEVAYYNPKPISEASGSWKLKDEEISIFIVLNDKNYQGSTYELKINERSGNFVGLYYQAISKQTYDVFFQKLSK